MAGVQEELARAGDSDRAIDAIVSRLDALPPLWSQLIDLSLEVAEVALWACSLLTRTLYVTSLPTFW